MVEAECVLGGREQAQHVGVRDGHALGLAGGARGVDHVGELLGQHGRGGEIVGRGCRAVFEQQRRGGRRQRGDAVEQGLAGQQHGGRAVVEHVAQALGRISGIERHVGGAGLEDAEHAGDQVETALDAEGDPLIGAHAALAQRLRDAIGARIEFAVGERLPVMQQRNRLGRAPGLRLEAPRQPALDYITCSRRAGRQHRLALRRRQHRHLAQQRRGRAVERLDDTEQGRLDIGRDARAVDPAGGQHGHAETLAQIVHRQRQRIVGALLGTERLDPLPGRARLARILVERVVAVVQQRAEQRRRRLHAAALARQRERRVLVAQQLRERAVRAEHRLAHAAVQRDANRQRIDEHAQRALGTGRALHAAEQHRAEHHAVRLRARPRGAVDHPRPGQVEQAGRAHAQRACRGAQANGQRAIQGMARLARAMPLVPRVAQPERQRRLGDVAEHLAEEGLVLGAAHAEPGLGQVVAERHRGRERLRRVQQEGANLALDAVERGVVEHQVMEQHQHQPAPGRRVVGDHGAHQRRARQVELDAARVEALAQLPARVLAGFQLDRLDLDRRLAPDHLHRLGQPRPVHRRAQDVVTRDHLLQRAEEGVEPLAAVEGEQAVEQVRVALLGHQVMEQHALLQRRERIDVLHVGRPARYGRHQRVELGLAEAHQRQQRRREVGGARRDRVGRHRHLRLARLARADRLGQRGQVGRAEQQAHVGMQAKRAHPLDHADGQQRMSAQREEVVVPADLRDAEHLAPDPRQRVFQLALRGHVAAARIGLVVGIGQCLAVGLAVARERQRRQPDVGGRQHVVGQQRQQVLAQRLAVHRLGVAVAGVVGHQPLAGQPAGRLGTRHHQRVAHRRMAHQLRADLAQLDAEAAQLDLVVVAAEEFDAAVRQPARQVAGAIHAAAGHAGRIGQEALGAQARAIEITVGEPFSAHVQLARHAHRLRLAARVEHVDTGVRQRAADRHRARRADRGVQRTEHREGGGLGRAVHAHQLPRGAALQHARHVFRGQQVAAHHQVAQPGEGRQQRVEILVEQADRHEQHVHAVREQRVAQARGRQQGGRVDHHAASAVEQRPPDFQGAGIEGRVRGEAEAIGRAELGVAAVQHQARDRALRHHHALGRAGRARGVHDVGRRFGAGRQRGRAGRATRQLARGGQRVEVDARRAGLRRVEFGRGQRGMREQQARAAVLQHEAQPLGRRRAVERHVDGAALEHGQLRHHQLDRALQQQRDARAARHAALAQVVRETVGALLQFAVAEREAAVFERDRLGRAGRLRLEQRAQARLARIVGAGGVPAVEDLFSLGRRQHVQLAHGARAVLLQRVEHRAQCLLDVAGDARAVERVDHMHHQAEAGLAIVDRQRQRVVGALLGTHRLDALPGLPRLLGVLGGIVVAVVQQRAEQRRRRLHAAALLGQRQRRVLVAQQLGERGVGAPDRLAHAVGQADAHRQGVDEHAQRVLGLAAALHAPEQHRAEYHVVAAGRAAHHLGPGEVEQTGGAHAQLARVMANPPRQRGLQLHARLADAVPLALRVLQAERQARLLHRAQHLREELLVRLAAHAQARLGHVAAERNRRRQLRGAAEQAGLHFARDAVERRVVDREVMEQHLHGPLAAARVPRDEDPHQRRPAQVQPDLARVEAALQIGQRVAVGGLHRHLVDLDRRLAPDHLHRLRQAFPQHRRAQDVVARDHLAQGRQEGVEARAIVEAEQRVEQVGVAVARHQVMEQHAFLQRRERVDVLHVGGAARHAGHDRIDVVLREPRERQHVGRDRLAAGGNRVRRHDHLPARFAAHGARQRGQGRGVEQHAHVGGQARAAHLREQLDRQQRMAAQFEEVVMAADSLDLQHLAPDPRKARFDLAFRFDVVAAAARLARLRQRLAVQLAVRRQRKHVELQQRRRHHIVRQARFQMRAQDLEARVPAFVAGVVAHQPAIAVRLLPHHHHRVANAGMRPQHRADFAQLDTEAPQLHLLVVAAQVDDVAVRLVTRQIARPVHARARRAERIGHEALRRQARPVQVTARHARAADEDLARHPHRHRLAAGVQDVDLRVRHRPADRHVHHARRQVLRVIYQAAHHRFGRAVFVDQPSARAHFLPQRHRARAQRFAADHERVGLRLDAFGTQATAQCIEVGRGDLHQARRVANMRFQPRDLVALVEQRDRAATQQRRPQAGDRRVERQRRGHHRAPLRRRLVRRQRPLQVVRQAAVRDHHALRTTRRSRGVDHIGQMLGQRATRRLRIRHRVEHGRIGIEAQRLERVLGQARAHRRLRQQHPRPAILQHVGQPFGRISRIDRHIGRAGLQHAQQPRHHVETTPHADRHARVGADAARDQGMGDLVGSRVEPRIAERCLAMPQRHRLRRAPRLRLDHPGQLHRRIRRLAAIPLPHHLRPIRRAEHVQLADPLPRIAHGGLEQVAVMADHPLDAGAIEQVGGVFERAGEMVAMLAHLQRQVELHRHRLAVEFRDLDARQRHRRRGLLEAEHHLEQRLARQVARRRQLGHQLLERQVLVGVGGQRVALDAAQQFGETRVAGQVGAQRQRIDEEADQPFQLLGPAPGHRRADHDVPLAAVAAEQGGEAGQQHHVERRRIALREFGEARHQLAGQHELRARAAEALLGGTRPVGRQFERDRRAVQRALPVVELLREPRLVEPFALPDRVVAVLHRQWRELDRTPGRKARVERAELAHQHVGGPAVRDDVVHVEQHHVAGVVEPHQRGAQQRPAGEIEGTFDLVAQQAIESGGLPRLVGFAAQIEARQRHRRGRLDDLARAALGGLEARAQDLMALDQRRERAFERLGPYRAAQAQRHRDVVAGAGQAQHLLGPDALLLVGQRQRRVGRAAAHRRHPAVLARRLGGLAQALDLVRQRGRRGGLEEPVRRQVDAEQLADP